MFRNILLAVAACISLAACAEPTQTPSAHLWICKTDRGDTFSYTGNFDPYYNQVTDSEGFERPEQYTKECKRKPV